MNVVNLYLHPTGKYTSKGQRYEVRYGAELIASGISPEFTACRAMLARGITGRALFWRKNRPMHDIAIDIEKGAGLTVSETQKLGLRFAKWVPFTSEEADKGVGAIEVAETEISTVSRDPEAI